MRDTLYHQDIIAAARESSGDRRLEAPTVSAMVDNPLCGDRVTIDLLLEGGHIAAVGHHVRGCALCQASAAVLAEEAVGKPVEEVEAAELALGQMIRHDGAAPPNWPKLAMFEPVKAIRNRHECVLLPFRAARRALSELEGGERDPR